MVTTTVVSSINPVALGLDAAGSATLFHDPIEDPPPGLIADLARGPRGGGDGNKRGGGGGGRGGGAPPAPPAAPVPVPASTGTPAGGSGGASGGGAGGGGSGGSGGGSGGGGGGGGGSGGGGSSDPFLAAAKASVGNGLLTFGFVADADPGLKPTEYILTPTGVARRDSNFREPDEEDPDFADKYAACLLSDAARVATFGLPDALVPFVAANRAMIYALGYGGDETVEYTGTAIDTAEVQNAHPHLATAVSMTTGIATLATFITTLLYWKTNHNTGGNILPKKMIAVLKQTLALPPAVSDEQITRAVYLGGHACEKRKTLVSILPEETGNKLVQARTHHDAYVAELDAWANTRARGTTLPAGTALIGVLRVLLLKVASCGLAGFSPFPEAVATLETCAKLVENNPQSFHPGARYLFNTKVEVLADIEDLKTAIGVFGGFCESADYCSTITRTKHLNDLIRERGEPKWTNMGKKFAKGVEVTDEDFNAAVAAYGVSLSGAVPKPTADNPGYVAACDALIGRIKAVGVDT